MAGRFYIMDDEILDSDSDTYFEFKTPAAEVLTANQGEVTDDKGTADPSDDTTSIVYDDFRGFLHPVYSPPWQKDDPIRGEDANGDGKLDSNDPTFRRMEGRDCKLWPPQDMSVYKGVDPIDAFESSLWSGHSNGDGPRTYGTFDKADGPAYRNDDKSDGRSDQVPAKSPGPSPYVTGAARIRERRAPIDARRS